jgi:adenosylcobinamide-GDP ribazoletransferase
VPVLARFEVMLLIVHTPYVRTEGLGTELKNQAQTHWVWFWCISLALLMLYLNLWLSLVVLTTAAIGYGLMRRLMLQRIHGWTGDTAGASIEMTELFLLLALSMAL